MEQNVITFHDDTSTNQDENLKTIVDFHNSAPAHQLDVSFHFNANAETSNPMGTEVFYKTQSHLATEVSSAIANAGGFKNRGPKYTTGLYFINGTDGPSILIETCFGDSKADVDLYNKNFEAICDAIAALRRVEGEVPVPKPETLIWTGKCSQFGGPDDYGVTPPKAWPSSRHHGRPARSVCRINQKELQALRDD